MSTINTYECLPLSHMFRCNNTKLLQLKEKVLGRTTRGLPCSNAGSGSREFPCVLHHLRSGAGLDFLLQTFIGVICTNHPKAPIT